MNGRVSILIPCYNAENWIAECVDSALAQEYSNIEVIVLDDGSSDASWERLQAFAGRASLHRQENSGGNATRNRLLELAGGEWLQYLDADDWLAPDKISRQIGFLQSLDRKPDILYGEVQLAWMEGDQVGLVEPSRIDGEDPWEQLVTWQLPQTGAPLWRREAVIDVGGWKPEQPCCQEHELYLRLLMGGKNFQYCGPTAAFYRQWSEGTVCKSNVPLVHEKRIEIVRGAREFLMKSGDYSPGRRAAVCQAFFETARSAYGYDRSRAEALYSFISRELPGFVPSGPAAPPAFRLFSRVLGYMGAERLAALLRR